MVDGKIQLPKFLCPKPVTFVSHTTPANSLFPRRSFRRAVKQTQPVSVDNETKKRLPKISYQDTSKKQSQHQSRRQDLSDYIQKKSKKPSRVRFALDIQEYNDDSQGEKLSSLDPVADNSTTEPDLYRTEPDLYREQTLESVKSRKWDQQKILDHPIHRLLQDRMDQIYQQEKLAMNFNRLAKERKSLRNSQINTLGIRLRTLPYKY